MARTKAAGPTHWVRRPMTYVGTKLSRGEMIQLNPVAINNQKLIERGFLMPIDHDIDPRECGICGKVFIDDTTRTEHGNLDHAAPRELTPDEEDRQFDKQMQRLEIIAPVFDDKSIASL